MDPTPPPTPRTLVDVLASVERATEDLRLEMSEDRRVNETRLRATQERIDLKTRLIRVCIVALVLSVAALGTGLAITYYQLDQARDQRAQIRQIIDTQTAAATQREIDQCLTANDRATALRDALLAFTDTLAAAGTPVATPEEQAVRDQRVAAFKENLTRNLASLNVRDCSAQALGLHPPVED